jgi:hypothetical protein
MRKVCRFRLAERFVNTRTRDHRVEGRRRLKCGGVRFLRTRQPEKLHYLYSRRAFQKITPRVRLTCQQLRCLGCV